jgi:hypothetical protein
LRIIDRPPGLHRVLARALDGDTDRQRADLEARQFGLGGVQPDFDAVVAARRRGESTGVTYRRGGAFEDGEIGAKFLARQHLVCAHGL